MAKLEEMLRLITVVVCICGASCALALCKKTLRSHFRDEELNDGIYFCVDLMVMAFAVMLFATTFLSLDMSLVNYIGIIILLTIMSFLEDWMTLKRMFGYSGTKAVIQAAYVNLILGACCVVAEILINKGTPTVRAMTEALGKTILIEIIVVSLKHREQKELWMLASVAVNMITNPILNGCIEWMHIQSYAVVMAAEVAIVCIEGWMYSWVLKTEYSEGFNTSLGANAASLLLGSAIRIILA